MHPITVLSFGHLHPWPEGVERPGDDLTFDLREKLRDPAHVPTGEMLDMTGLQDDVVDYVFETAGAKTLFFRAVVKVKRAAKVGPATIAFGCAGGRHRSVAFARELHSYLANQDLDVSVQHLHVHLPRVIRQETKG